MGKLLNIPDTARTIVYNTIIAALKADATLSATVKSWNTFTEANVQQAVPFDNPGLPAIEIMPMGLPASPEAQVLQNSPFGIHVVVTTPGMDVRDLLNLWGAFEKVLFPGDGSKTLNNAIRAALASGAPPASLQTINLSQPVFAPAGDTHGTRSMVAQGQIVAMMTVPK